MGKKTLVVYYSQANGNTKHIAEQVQKALGADIARIETVTPYTGTYDEIVVQGQQEVASGFQPEIKPLSVNLADYDTVAIGTPTWWYTVAPAVLTFLVRNSWGGKTVIPFQTHGGWPGHVMEDMERLCQGATMAHGFSVQFDSTGGDRQVTPDEALEDWLAELEKAAQ